MYIKTDKGSILPWSSVQVLKPNKEGGCTIILNTGTSARSSRTVEKVLEDLVYFTPDLAPIVATFSEVLTEVSSLKSQVAQMGVTLTQAVESTTSEVTKACKALDTLVDSVKVSATKLTVVTLNLEGIVNDEFSEDTPKESPGSE